MQFRLKHYALSELAEETCIVLVEKSHVIDLVLKESDSLKTYTEGKALILLRVNAAHLKNVRMNHTAAENFYPALSLTETAALSAALEAGNINLC
jgi:hypothetical protein